MIDTNNASFMWGYQRHFAVLLEMLATAVMERLGIAADPKVLLVGVTEPSLGATNPVCVEPEDGRWTLDLFATLVEDVQRTASNHPLVDILYGDALSNAEKPGQIQRDSVTTAVLTALSSDDQKAGVTSFGGVAQLVGDHYIVPIIQVPTSALAPFPSIELPRSESWSRVTLERSLIDAAMKYALQEASEELKRKDPGRSSRLPSAAEVLRSAATAFMYTPGFIIESQFAFVDLFQRFNTVSSLMYEGVRGLGHMILADPTHSEIEYILRFKDPVPFSEPRWVRKILQMASPDTHLVANTESIFGLGRLRHQGTAAVDDIFTIEFTDHYHWELRCNQKRLLRSRYGEPSLPQGVMAKERFLSNYARLFPASTPVEQERLWALFNAAVSLPHGSMIVVAEDAREEAARLGRQGTPVEPTEMTGELYARASGIDGTVLVDPSGICHAVGVILDGAATEDCTPSRGSRFNSGVRYVASGKKQRLAIVISDDESVDMFPLLLPLMSKSQVESQLQALETATLETYHQPRNWLDTHRFYLTESQCTRANAALDRIEASPLQEGSFLMNTARFSENPVLNDSYFLP